MDQRFVRCRTAVELMEGAFTQHNNQVAIFFAGAFVEIQIYEATTRRLEALVQPAKPEITFLPHGNAIALTNRHEPSLRG